MTAGRARGFGEVLEGPGVEDRGPAPRDEGTLIRAEVFASDSAAHSGDAASAYGGNESAPDGGDAGPGVREPAASDLTSDRYEILGPIAQGGMATVFLARSHRSNGPAEVILKRLPPEFHDRADFVAMFEDEASLGVLLRHPNVVPVTDRGILHGSRFMAMELVRGVNLAMFREAMNRRGEKTPIQLAVEIARQALRGLAFAHALTDEHSRALEIIHRDVSPENILIGYDGLVRVVDFGVAKARFRIHKTEFGLVKGKFGYMAPEQVMVKPLDLRVDIFALSTVLYELLTDSHPFQATSPILQLQRIVEDVPKPMRALRPEIPLELERTVMRGLAKAPEDRFTNALAMIEALDEVALVDTAARGPIGTTSDQSALSRCVQELFHKRLSLESRARREGDSAALVAALAMTTRSRTRDDTPPVAVRTANDGTHRSSDEDEGDRGKTRSVDVDEEFGTGESPRTGPVSDGGTEKTRILKSEHEDTASQPVPPPAPAPTLLEVHPEGPSRGAPRAPRMVFGLSSLSAKHVGLFGLVLALLLCIALVALVGRLTTEEVLPTHRIDMKRSVDPD